MLYLGLYLGLYFILITASSGGVYIYSCCSYYSCYRVAGAVIKIASSIVIRTTYSTAVEIASKIGEAASKINKAFYKTFYRASYRA